MEIRPPVKIDWRHREASRGSMTIKMEPMLLRILELLLDRSGEVITVPELAAILTRERQRDFSNWTLRSQIRRLRMVIRGLAINVGNDGEQGLYLHAFKWELD